MATRPLGLVKRSFLLCLVFSCILLVFWFNYERQAGKTVSVVLLYNSTTKALNLTRSVQPVLLFIGIPSAAKYHDRRNAIRETWMTQCRSSKEVVCLFFTNREDLKGNPLPVEVQWRLGNESLQHGDLIYAESPPGKNLGTRYLWLIKWAREHYDFKYLLKLDDDYFICFKKLVMELEHHRPRQRFTWGWLHCEPRMVYLDEGFFLATKDVIEYFLSRENTLLCHPFADQEIGIWLSDFKNLIIFGDNARLFHNDFEPKDKVMSRSEICQTALGIHKSYPEETRMYWDVYLKEKNDTYKVPSIEYPCHLKPALDYKAFAKPWFAEPKPCKDNPVWGVDDHYIGRGGK